MADLSALLAPRSVAVIGASDDTTTIRGMFMKTILRHGFDGPVHAISRSSAEVFGHKTYDHISKAPGPIDLAALIAPAEACPSVLEDCAKTGVRAAIVIASGFAEEGSDQGRALQAEMKRVAADNYIALCGPNSQGIVDTRSGLAATFSPVAQGLDPVLPRPAPAGRGLAIVTQSGALGFGLFDAALASAIPVDRVITTGNEAGLTLSDYLNHLIDEDRAEGYLLFLEEVRDGPGFIRFAERALAGAKPVVVLRAGRSFAGRRAAASHTGALADGDAGYSAVFRRYNIVEAVSTEEAVALAGALVACASKTAAGYRVGVCSSTGGGAGLVADLCEEAGLLIPTLDDATRAKLEAVMPSYGESSNPVDTTAQAIRRIGYAGLAGMVAASTEIDAIIAAVSGHTENTTDEQVATLAALDRNFAKPIIFWCYTPPTDDLRRTMERAGLPLLTDARAAVRVISALARSRVLRERKPVAMPDDEASLLPDRHILPEHEAYPLLAPFGVTTGDHALVKSADVAATLYRQSGKPVALTIQSQDILHKSDAGGVALDLNSEAAVRDAYQTIMERVGKVAPDATIDGILIQEMAPPGVEIILGVTVDPRFGPLIMIGLGGVFVEVMGDVAFAPAPLGPDDARDMLESLKGWPMLTGVRGAAPADVEALIDLMIGLSRFAWAHRDAIEEIDINPVMVHPAGQGVTVVDALIVQTV